MSRKRKLTTEQHRQLAERNLLYFKLRLEAAKHSPATLAREFGIPITTLRTYLNRKVERELCKYPRCKWERGHIGAHVV